jgi:hypothetical protein
MANTEGNTPGKTPETTTRLAHFHIPDADGVVHYGDESWPIHANVVECPIEVGAASEWARATPDQIAAHSKAVNGPTLEELAGDILSGSVAEVEEAVKTLDTLNVIEAMQIVEAAKPKARKGVLDAIAARLDVLTKPPKT